MSLHHFPNIRSSHRQWTFSFTSPSAEPPLQAARCLMRSSGDYLFWLILSQKATFLLTRSSKYILAENSYQINYKPVVYKLHIRLLWSGLQHRNVWYRNRMVFLNPLSQVHPSSQLPLFLCQVALCPSCRGWMGMKKTYFDCHRCLQLPGLS